MALVDARLPCDAGPADTTAFCSGVLVAPRVVMTAAHCVEGRSPGSIEVYFGDALGVPGASGSFASVVASVVPSDRDAEGSDLALLRLGAPVPIAPLRLDTTAPDGRLGQAATVAGFGEAVATGDAPGIKREGTATIAEVGPVVRLAPAPSLPCRGDSGGPLLVASGGDVAVLGVVARADASCSAWADVTRIDGHAPLITSFLELAEHAPGAPEAQAESGSCGPCEGEACATGLSCEAQPSGVRACARAGLPPGRLGATCTTSASCGGDACLAVPSGGGRACFCYVPCASEDRCAAASPLPALSGHRCASDGCAVGSAVGGAVLPLVLAALVLGRRRLAALLALLAG